MSISVSHAGTILVTHAGVNSVEDLNWVKARLAQYMVNVTTPYVNSNNDQGVQTKRLVTRVLCDVIDRTLQLFNESADNPMKTYDAINHFCRPRVVTQGDGTELLRMTKHVCMARTVLTTIVSPLILTGVALLAPTTWAMGGSVKSHAQVLLRRSAARFAEPLIHYRLDSGYSVQDENSSIVSSAQSAACGLVRSVAPAVAHNHGVGVAM